MNKWGMEAGGGTARPGESWVMEVRGRNKKRQSTAPHGTTLIAGWPCISSPWTTSVVSALFWSTNRASTYHSRLVQPYPRSTEYAPSTMAPNGSVYPHSVVNVFYLPRRMMVAQSPSLNTISLRKRTSNLSQRTPSESFGRHAIPMSSSILMLLNPIRQYSS